MSAFDSFMTAANKRINDLEVAIRSLPRPDGMPRGLYLDGGTLEGQITPDDGTDTTPEEVEFWAAMEAEESARREWSESRMERE